MNITESAMRAAAFAVVMLEHGLLEQITYIQIQSDEGVIYPRVHTDGSYDENRGVSFPPRPLPKSLPDNWWMTALIASEVIALPWLKARDWEALELEGLAVAAQLVREVPDGPLYGVGYELCRQWFEMDEGEEKQRHREIAEARFIELWSNAVDVIRNHAGLIAALAAKLKKCRPDAQGYRGMEAREIMGWWQEQLSQCDRAAALEAGNMLRKYLGDDLNRLVGLIDKAGWSHVSAHRKISVSA